MPQYGCFLIFLQIYLATVLGFETAEPWPLERLDQDGVTPTRAILARRQETRRHHAG